MDLLRGCTRLQFRTRAVWMVLLIAVTLSSGPAAISTAGPSGASPKQTKLVLLDLKVSDTEFHVGTLDAGTARVTLPNRLRLEVVPTILGDTLDVRVWAVTFDAASGQDKRVDVVHLTLSRDESTSFPAGAFSIAISWNGVKDGGDETAVEGCTQCCMTCGETTVCACFVEAPCGRCCCDLCCAILDGVIRDPRF